MASLECRAAKDRHLILKLSSQLESAQEEIREARSASNSPPAAESGSPSPVLHGLQELQPTTREAFDEAEGSIPLGLVSPLSPSQSQGGALFDSKVVAEMNQEPLTLTVALNLTLIPIGTTRIRSTPLSRSSSPRPASVTNHPVRHHHERAASRPYHPLSKRRIYPSPRSCGPPEGKG